MLISDGVTPGNEGRGYVLRRIMRRTVRSMRLLGAHQPVFGELADVSIAAMQAQYPELARAFRAAEEITVRWGADAAPGEVAAFLRRYLESLAATVRP